MVATAEFRGAVSRREGRQRRLFLFRLSPQLSRGRVPLYCTSTQIIAQLAGIMDTYKILRATDGYIVLITNRDGKRSWSPWFANKAQAQSWIIEQTMNAPSTSDG